MADAKFDLECENFDLYFEKVAATMSQPMRASAKKDILFKMARKKLSFLGKLWVLWRYLNKRVWLVVEEEDGGLTVEQFVELREAIKRRDFGVPKSEELITSGTFVTASKELGDTFDYLNGVATGGAYNYLLRDRKRTNNKVAQRNEQMDFLCRFLTHYESNRKRIMINTRIEMSEWLVLIYLFHGKEMKCSPIWKEVYRFSYNSSRTKLTKAYITLQDRSYIEKRGYGKHATFKITPLGRAAVNDIMSRFVLNF